MEKCVLRRYLVILIVLPLFTLTDSLHAQILINEVVSSNSVHLDEDGDSPDWFELYNSGSTAVNLKDWSVTDDVEEPDKWLFPDVVIEPGEHMVIWASGKDRLSNGFPRTLIQEGDEYRYRVPNSNIDNWFHAGFNDSGWSLGFSGFGYGDGDDGTTVSAGSPSVYARRAFVLQDVANISQILLDIDYDDSFVAYINGVEIARSNVYGNPPEWNTLANVGREAQVYNGGRFERFVLENSGQLLQEGTNVFAVEAHNLSTSSSDMSLIPFLSFIYSTSSTVGIDPPEVLNLTNRYLHTNFSISSDGEPLILLNPDGTTVDAVELPELPPDVSFGRSASQVFVLHETPTPGTVNSGTTYEGRITNEVQFSEVGGITTANSVTLSGAVAPEQIRFTLDGTEPNENSTLYTGPIDISSTQTIRAAIYRTGFYPSKSTSRSFIKGSNHALPIFSLVTDPANFFDSDNGIYVLGDDYPGGDYPYFGSNIWEDWERPIHVTLYEEDGTLGTAFNAGVKIFGGWSRAQAQKSLSLFARGQYGDNEIKYPIFPDYPYEEFQALVLRNSGNDFLYSNIRDGVLTSLMKTADLEIQAFRPVVTYLNGEYWGVYNLREKVNEHFLASKANVDPDDIDILETDANIIQGTNEDYVAMLQFIEQNSMIIDPNFDQVAEQIDIDNFITYQMAQIYFNNTDWPGNNIKYWKHKNGKWRWILFDTDFGFGIYNANDFNNNTLAFALQPNGPGWPNPPWSTYLFRSLINNFKFRKRFINHFADNLNTRFLPTKVTTHIDSIVDMVQPEMADHYARWGGNYQSFINNVNNMKNWGQNRPAAIKEHIKDYFNLPAVHEVTISNNNPNFGYVQLNSLKLTDDTWSGDYFEGIPIELTAVPEPGYEFVAWSGDLSSTEPNIFVGLSEAITINAVFESSDQPNLPIVINEINYNSSETKDSEDWVELYNPNRDFRDLSGYVIKDDDDTHAFVLPEGTLLQGRSFLVISRNQNDFEAQYPGVSPVLGDMDFGLSSDGDAVRLYNNNGGLIDEVYYQSSSPWPLLANGEGWTLELVNPLQDNQVASNWSSLNPFGSPGEPNLLVSSTSPLKEHQQLHYYPNPFSQSFILNLSITKTTEAQIQLFDIMGKAIFEVHHGVLTAGTHEFNVNLPELKEGFYLLRYADNEGTVETRRLVKQMR